jgi:hypothetical protein
MQRQPERRGNEYHQGLMEIFSLSGEEKRRWSETNRNILVNYLERTGKVGKELVDEIGQVQ